MVQLTVINITSSRNGHKDFNAIMLVILSTFTSAYMFVTMKASFY